jgi:hypothetical protein
MVEVPRRPTADTNPSVEIKIVAHHTKQAGQHRRVSDPGEDLMLPLYRDEERLVRRSALHRWSGVRSSTSAERILQAGVAMCMIVPILLLLRHQVSSWLLAVATQR